MDNNERMLVIDRSFSIAEMERDLADEEAFEEFETSETVETAVPAAIHDSGDDDDEGPTGIFEIGPYQAGAEWLQRV